MTDTNISIQPFEAEYLIRYTDGRSEWLPCTVVGVAAANQWSSSHFIIIHDEGDITYASVVESVRRRKPSHQMF